MSYLKRNGRTILSCLAVAGAFNLYFLFLMRERQVGRLVYLDFLLLAAALCFASVDYCRFQKREEKKRRLLELDEVITGLLPEFENKRIAEHDIRILQKRQQRLFDESCELQDYVAKWSHEWKLPLAASLLMSERIADRELRAAMREQLEKMNQQMHSMLAGCRLQSPLLDLQYKRASLLECVRAAIHSQQFFLIQNGFSIELQVGEETAYTDPAWLVYILEQLLSNAVKYGKKEGDSAPVLCIRAKREEDAVRLSIEDHGEGIKEADLRRIFEKGYTGTGHHNERYKSTGLGLYLAAKIAGRLGHELSVKSRYGEYTRFCLVFWENSYFRPQSYRECKV